MNEIFHNSFSWTDKISARREKTQIYLQFSEPPPNFKMRSRLKKCKARENANFNE